MIKNMLIMLVLLTFCVQANAMQERKIVKKSNFTKQVVRCSGGTKSFILARDDIYYSDSYKKFLFAKDAAKASCNKKHLRSKKGAIVCVRKKDLYRLLSDSLKNKTKAKAIGSCLKFNRSIPLNITDHFPFTSKITYYEIDYKGKKLYLSSQSIYNAKKYTKSKKKKRVQKRSYKKKKVQKRKYKKKSVKRNKIAKSINSIQNKYDNNLDTYNDDYKSNLDTYNAKSDNAIASTTTQAPTIQKTSIDDNTNIKSSKTTKKQYYTYRCIGTYGDNRITVDNDLSMTHASNSVWRRCQALKKNDEVCKITDCYKLIK